MGRWLVKTEPATYALADLEREGTAPWDGVRNALAQQYLRQMELEDPVLIYHSGREKAIVGLAEVIREKYLDPTDERGKAVCVDVKFVARLGRAVTLKEVRAHPRLQAMALVRISRLSVMPVSRTHWGILMELAGRPE